MVDYALERTLVATLIARPELVPAIGDFDAGYLYDFQARCAWDALCDLVFAGQPVNGEAVALRLEAKGFVSAVAPYLGWLPGLLRRASADASEAQVVGWAASLVRLATRRDEILAEPLDE